MYTPIRSTFLALALAAAWPAVSPQAALVSVHPYLAEAGKPFTVTVTGQTDLCMPIWTHMDAKVSGDKLFLEAAGANNPAAICTAGPHAFSVDIPVLALKAGVYEVRFQRRMACEFAMPPCLPFNELDTAGSLTVLDQAGLAYPIKPRAAAANKPFDLLVTSRNFTCGNTYSGLSVTVRDWQIMLSFTNKPNPAALCPAVIADYGPTFKIPALPQGTYQVISTISPYCGTDGPCPLALVAPQLSGALQILGAEDRFKPRTEPGLVPAGGTFSLELHGPYDCNDVMTEKQVEVKDGVIRLSYSLVRTKKMCADTIFIHHENFTVPALAAGDFPVVLSPRDCAYTDHFLCLQTVAPRVIDTVTATMALGVKARSQLPGAPRGNRSGVKLRWRGEAADAAGRRQK